MRTKAQYWRNLAVSERSQREDREQEDLGAVWIGKRYLTKRGEWELARRRELGHAAAGTLRVVMHRATYAAGIENVIQENVVQHRVGGQNCVTTTLRHPCERIP